MIEYSINHILSTEKIKNHFYADDEFVKFFIHWATDILKEGGFDTPLYHLYYATIDVIGYPPHQGKFKPKMLVLKYVEPEPDYDDEDFDILEYIEGRVQEKRVAVPDYKEFVINNPTYLEENYVSGYMMPKISFEIFRKEDIRSYSGLAVRKKWEGLP
ncbi:hypothetical protein SAMN05428949_1982 [Chitinophaga sp. YR627]|uniref:hypothetical protein n=1 Tax=Chitinophaga sp. YR627 TaxID=1881041 RepID=UPI0008ED74B5|nr:hypothetical protein [Chitinophaga sp. YR627]SFN21897.1 hypothetical protein SAMN05428949_1982 [Chitinophaga sp. YR627]